MSGASRWLDANDGAGANAAPAATNIVPTPRAATVRRGPERMCVFTVDPFLERGLPGAGAWTLPAGLHGVRSRRADGSVTGPEMIRTGYGRNGSKVHECVRSRSASSAA